MALSVNTVNSSLFNICGFCHIEPPAGDLLKTCGKCKTAYYCSIACQKQAWPEHKKGCRPFVQKSVVPILLSESKIAPFVAPPTITGFLRFMNISVDAQNFGLFGSRKEIWIPGPGLKQIDGKPHCPQLAEALKLWDHSHFTILENNSTVLHALKSMDYQLPIPMIEKIFEINTKAIDCLPSMLQVMVKLKDETPRENVVDLREFRMGRDDPKDLPQADVMIATYSLFYPMKEILKTNTDPSGDRRLDLLVQFASKLKIGGVLYIDIDCMGCILHEKAEDLNFFEKRMAVCSPENLKKLMSRILENYHLSLRCKFLAPILTVDGPEGKFVMQSFCEETGESVEIQTKTVFAFQRAKLPVSTTKSLVKK